jgi:rifampin ADP-ribosylating transferase
VASRLRELPEPQVEKASGAAYSFAPFISTPARAANAARSHAMPASNESPRPFVITHPCRVCNGQGKTESDPACSACHATGATRFFHGTKADLKPGDLIEPGRDANFGKAGRTANHVYFAGTLDAATWGAELARGDDRARIYFVEPTGQFEDDPNLTNKKFPGNPTRSYRSRAPLRVTGELANWQGHSPEQLKAMKEGVEAVRQTGDAQIDD